LLHVYTRPHASQRKVLQSTKPGLSCSRTGSRSIGPLPPTRKLAQVALADIGAVAVRLLEDPGRFAGKRFDLASDDLTGDDIVAILSRVTGHPFTYFQVPLDVIRQRMGEDGAMMYEWFDRVGYAIDRAALHREFPDVAFHDFESWAKALDWKALLRGPRTSTQSPKENQL
jgi:uncharacterized protein YbjT (DUF2867 family)